MRSANTRGLNLTISCLLLALGLAQSRVALAQPEAPASEPPPVAGSEPEEPKIDPPSSPESSPLPEPTPSPDKQLGAPQPVAAPNQGDAGPAKHGFKVTPTGYLELYYAYNLNKPSNNITAYRGFDNRHNTPTISNAAFGVDWSFDEVSGRVIFQVGSTPSSYYGAEPSLNGSSSTNPTNGELWKLLQEAYLGYKAPVGRGLLLQGGLFLSPIGYEAMAVKDNWNLSRSNLFFGLPFYHTGLRATYEWTDRVSSTLSLFNGWNSVVDNNDAKSVQANVTYTDPRGVSVKALYFGGVERGSGAPEGPYWRHHFEATGQLDATDWLSLAAEVDYGFEPNRIGTSRWLAGAAYARVRPVKRVYLALRADRFNEDLATDGQGRSSEPIFWGGAAWVSSGTATIDVRPVDPLSVRFEYRHDVSESPLFFGQNVRGSGEASSPYIANARTQDTLTLGATAWF